MAELKLALEHDTSKELKHGKRRYSDEEGHNLYLSGDEVSELQDPTRLVLVITAA